MYCPHTCIGTCAGVSFETRNGVPRMRLRQGAYRLESLVGSRIVRFMCVAERGPPWMQHTSTKARVRLTGAAGFVRPSVALQARIQACEVPPSQSNDMCLEPSLMHGCIPLNVRPPCPLPSPGSPQASPPPPFTRSPPAVIGTIAKQTMVRLERGAHRGAMILPRVVVSPRALLGCHVCPPRAGASPKAAR